MGAQQPSKLLRDVLKYKYCPCIDELVQGLAGTMTILRYPTNNVVTTGQDRFLDMSDWLGFLCAEEYLVQLLRQSHGFSANEARSRARLIIPHVRIALAYVQQALDGPREISFLPAYYAILNLMKVYVLLGPLYDRVPRQRWHGATYEGHSKDSQSILTEVITLRHSGAFPLFYRTITGKILTATKVKLQMKDVLPYVNGVAYEYKLATGDEWLLCPLNLSHVSKQNGQHPLARVGRLPPGS